MTPEALSISLKRCSKTFPDGARVLDAIDLDISAGETLVLLGPSGCGKTTTLRLIAGLDRPDPGGQVLFGGDDVTDRPIEHRHVGMVFQSYALFPNMNVADNVGYGLRVRKVRADEQRERVRQMLAMMRIEALADRHIDQLSGGQRQRVALARALAAQPRALLLDEPLTALDAQLRETLRLEIGDLLRRLGITSVYVTHDQAEAMALGDRIVVMSHGRIEQIGTPQDIYHRPASHFVAEFIGTMNRVTGRVEAGFFNCPDGRLPWPDAPASTRQALFRPEDARLVPPDANGGLSGVVSSAFFLGDRTRVLIALKGGRQITVDAPGRDPVAVGTPIGVAVAHACLLHLEDPSAC